MSRIILIFPIDTDLILIEKYLQQAIKNKYETIIVKLVPFNNLDIYIYKNINFFSNAIKKYIILYNVIKNNYPEQKLLFNLELNQKSIPLYLKSIQNFSIPIFIDYFYQYGDKLFINELKQLKKQSCRLDFNYIFTDHNEKKPLLNNLFDNYDYYYIDNKFYESFITYHKEINNKINDNDLNLNLNFNEVLIEYHSSPSIFFYENNINELKLYLFGFNRFYDIGLLENDIINSVDFLKKTISFLNKKINKEIVCMDCIYRNKCFINGYWINHPALEKKENCIIYNNLKNEKY